jgi:phage/plasmid-associated DNA primase
MDCDLDGIHFINGRFDCHTGQFTEREHPNFNRPETFVTVFIPYPFDVVKKDLCDTVYDSLLKSFGSREKLDYCLAYAGAALNGRSAITSCSCMFHVGIGGSGKTTFINWIKAAMTDVYYKDLPLNIFDNMSTASRTFSTIAPSIRFMFAPELNTAPKNSSVIKCMCDGEITTTKLYANGSFDIKINAKAFCTSNNAVVFAEDDTGILRRVLYCLHENRFVKEENLHLVDNVHVFADEPFDHQTVPVPYRLAMFQLMVAYGRSSRMERPSTQLYARILSIFENPGGTMREPILLLLFFFFFFFFLYNSASRYDFLLDFRFFSVYSLSFRNTIDEEPKTQTILD